MMGKIEWYREVLELEPGSKIFFPLARLLAEQGLDEEAIAVLRKGVSFHPEFFEARLLLVELLHKSGDASGCGSEVARLAGLFRNYPAFWDAWGENSREEDQNPDFGVVLSFIGALMRQGDLTLVEVLRAGLDSLRGLPVAAAPREAAAPRAKAAPSAPEADALTPVEESAVEAAPEVMAEPAPAAEQAQEAVQEPFQEAAPVPEAAPLPAADLISSRFAAAAKAAGITAEEGGSRRTLVPTAEVPEKCSLRTRSMAEVLAEQGDIRASIDIYEELLAVAAPHQRPAMEQRLKELRGAPDRVTLTLPVTLDSEAEEAEAAAEAKDSTDTIDTADAVEVTEVAEVAGIMAAAEADLDAAAEAPGTAEAEDRVENAFFEAVPAGTVLSAPDIEPAIAGHTLDLAPLAGEALLSLDDDAFVPQVMPKAKSSSSKSLRLLEKLARRLENRARQ